MSNGILSARWQLQYVQGVAKDADIEALLAQIDADWTVVSHFNDGSVHVVEVKFANAATGSTWILDMCGGGGANNFKADELDD